MSEVRFIAAVDVFGECRTQGFAALDLCRKLEIAESTIVATRIEDAPVRFEVSEEFARTYFDQPEATDQNTIEDYETFRLEDAQTGDLVWSNGYLIPNPEMSRERATELYLLVFNRRNASKAQRAQSA
jgi:hypothetical protein